jgi:hypothetical protein
MRLPLSRDGFDQSEPADRLLPIVLTFDIRSLDSKCKQNAPLHSQRPPFPFALVISQLTRCSLPQDQQLR